MFAWYFVLMLLGLMALGGAVIWAKILTERLIDCLFVNDHDRWVAVGKPIGGRITRNESSFWLSGITRDWHLNQWLVESPGWARNGEPAKILRQLRIAVLVMIACILVVAAAGVYAGVLAT